MNWFQNFVKALEILGDPHSISVLRYYAKILALSKEVTEIGKVAKIFSIVPKDMALLSM